MAHSYSFKTPNLSLDEEIVRFFEDFYRISDTPGNHDNYVDQFADDATFIVAHKKNHGSDGRSPRSPVNISGILRMLNPKR